MLQTKYLKLRHWVAAILLAMIVLTSLASTARADATNADTRATVTFTEGELTMGGELTGSSLNLDFGKHVLPVQKSSYPAVNEKEGVAVDHVLRVEDARAKSGNWNVTVSLTSFVDATGVEESFQGAVILKNPALHNVNSSAGVTGLTVPGELTIISGQSAIAVMTTDATLPRGIFSATWENQDVTLNISDQEVSKLGVAGYSATLNWTLNIGPV